MTDYNYQNGKFSDKDSLPPGDPAKIIRGQDFEDEFPKVVGQLMEGHTNGRWIL